MSCVKLRPAQASCALAFEYHMLRLLLLLCSIILETTFPHGQVGEWVVKVFADNMSISVRVRVELGANE